MPQHHELHSKQLPSVLESGLYPPYFKNYFDCVPDLPLSVILSESYPGCFHFWENLAPPLLDHRYAAGKWSPREILCHITDTERILSYRALALARGEKQELPGFDHNRYVQHSAAAKRHWQDLLEEYRLVRRSSQLLFESFDQKQWAAHGRANGHPISVLALAYMLPGHDLHHQKILRERYLQSMTQPKS